MTFDHDLKATVRTISGLPPSRESCFATSPRCWPTPVPSGVRVDELVQALGRQQDRQGSPASRRGALSSGGAVAHQVSAGFVPIRKKGKLPHTTVRIAYSLEYGLDEMEMHADAVLSRRTRHPGRRSHRHRRQPRRGAVKLLRQIDANVVAACFHHRPA